MNLKQLLNPSKYIQFLYDIVDGKYPVNEALEWIDWFNGNRDELKKVLATIAKILFKKHYTVLYPIEMIVVPRYPFTKQPMVGWKELQGKDFGDQKVNELKEACSKLGNLINVGFLLRNFVLVDIDSKDIGKSIEVDIETRRGYHKIFYIDGFPAVKMKLGKNVGFKLSINCLGVKVDIISGSSFLGSHPLQSRYLEYKDEKINVRSYKIVSKDADIAFRSADLTLLKATVDDVKDYISRLMKALGCEGYCKQIELQGVEKEEEVKELPDVNPKLSRFNVNPVKVLPSFDYKEFKDMLKDKLSILPTCLRIALFGTIEKGHRWFHLRLLTAVLPFFVSMDKLNIEAMVNDFASRTNSTRSDVRKWLYDIKYFTGRLILDNQEIIVPSKLGVPAEAWSDFETLGYCDNCPLAPSCRRLKGSMKRRLIVAYIAKILGEST